MGEHADDLIDSIIDNHMFDDDDGGYDYDYVPSLRRRRKPREDYLSGIQPGEWKVKGGKILQISQMETFHLENTINFLSTNGIHPRKRLEMEAELVKRDVTDGDRPDLDDEIPF